MAKRILDQHSDTSPVGQKIGPYEIAEFLARGGMGTLFRATHTLMRRDCVLKLIRPEHQANREVVRRFLREIRLGSMLMHPNIVMFYDAGQVDEHIFIVMEYFPSTNLTKLYTDNPAPVEDAVHIATQVTSALAVAHADGVLHRDIKPQNVLVGEDGVIKICDFGLAKALDNPEFSVITTSEKILGSPAFMAPESIKGARAMTVRTDVYGVGAILYFCLTGHPPYKGRNAVELIQQLGQPFSSPADERSDIPSALDKIVMKAMAPRQDDRFESAEAIREALEKIRIVDTDSFSPEPPPGAIEREGTHHSEILPQPAEEVGQASAVEGAQDSRMGLACAEELAEMGPIEPFVRVYDFGSQYLEIKLEQRPLVIGRAEGCDIRLDHETISRKHAVLVPMEDSFAIQDVGSRAGTFVNGQLVSKALLRHGDSIQISHMVLEFYKYRVPAASESDALSAMDKALMTQFRRLPLSMKLRWRTLRCPPQNIFREGDTQLVSGKGILVPSREPPSPQSCLDVELVLPNGIVRVFLGEVIGMVTIKKCIMLCVKLHNVEKQVHGEVTRFCQCGKWIG